MRIRVQFALFVLVTLFPWFASPALAQDEVPTRVTVQNRTGDLPFSTSIGTEVEHVDAASGNLLITIPFASVPGRGLNYSFALRYDARFLVVGNRFPAQGPAYSIWNIENKDWFPDTFTGLGWQLNKSRITYGTLKINCQTPNPNDATTYRTNFMYHDPNGGKHPLAYQFSSGGSCGGVADVTGPDLTGEGILASSGSPILSPPIFLSDGTRRSWQDPNGNSAGEGAGTLDSLGRTIVTQQNGTNQVLYKIYDSNGALQTYTVNYTTISVLTNFNVNGVWGTRITEYSCTRKVISSIILPNGRSYQFQYESGTYGALTRIDLPTGGYITYTWATLRP